MDGFEYEVGVVVDFLDEHWAEFLKLCEEQGIDEAEAEALCSKMAQFAGRSK